MGLNLTTPFQLPETHAFTRNYTVLQSKTESPSPKKSILYALENRDTTRSGGGHVYSDGARPTTYGMRSVPLDSTTNTPFPLH